ncbi:hypothetical protein [Microbacterium hominis]|uniref:Metallophosphoesterase n=1 Tax=Microbacterium hominis TaxID=162426 RepID=A0A7D4QJH8_9MICO|nr:hypothetical protein [Microbacterium hominis]QKJ19916.1 hypothetical protein HQM25_11480 [Microbacterium hominis]
MPRPYRLTLGTASVLCLGGAASVDRAWRTPGRTWFPEERITDAMVDAAIAGGAADVLLTHESPHVTATRNVRTILLTNPGGFPDEALEESRASRQQIDRVVDAVTPAVHLHGHMHTASARITADDAFHTYSLADAGAPGHLGIPTADPVSFTYLLPQDPSPGHRASAGRDSMHLPESPVGRHRGGVGRLRAR